MMEPVYLLTYVLTIVGFCTLAAILLVPIYRFLKREEQRNQQEYRRRPAGRPSGVERSDEETT